MCVDKAPCCGASNEYPQSMFGGEVGKICVWIKHLTEVLLMNIHNLCFLEKKNILWIKHLAEVLLLSIHNMFFGEVRKICVWIKHLAEVLLMSIHNICFVEK